MRVNKILETSLVDGPGVRSVLFLQGCSFKCKNCHNVKAQNFEGGTFLELKEVVKLILKKCRNKKITISGGEPLEQYDEVVELCKMLKKLDFNIFLYTGFIFEKVDKKIFKYIDYIKTGSYVEKLKDDELAYRGSSNQHLYKIEGGKCIRIES